MKVTVKITDNFKKEVKSLLKKYASLKTDLKNLEKELIENPKSGTSLGNNSFKVRLKINSKGKGKSGGARVITLLETDVIATIVNSESETIVNLITIYDKSATENISDKELKRLLLHFKNE